MRTNIASPLAQTAAGAIAEEVLRACVHCGMCNATCPTYQLTGDELDGPRGRIYLIKQALEGEAVGQTTQHHLDRCLSCRACETTCPSGVDYHRLLDVGRGVVAERVPRAAPQRLIRAALRLFLLKPPLRTVLVALARLTTRKIPPAVPRGPRPTALFPRRMTMLAGCVQSATAPHFNAATARVFAHAGIGLDSAPAAGCCGALSFHLDAREEARALARRNIDAWIHQLDAGAEAVVINASGCAAFVRDYPDVLADDPDYADKARRVARHIRDPIEILDGLALTPRRSPATPLIAVHEPCTLQHGARLGGRIARLLTTLGYDPQPVADAHLCCGSAGAYALLQPDLSGRLRANKVAALNARQPAAIYTANIGCWMHLAETSPAPVRHWIEAVDDVLGPP